MGGVACSISLSGGSDAIFFPFPHQSLNFAVRARACARSGKLSLT